MMHDVSASISVACSGVKNSNCCGTPDCTEWCACCTAAKAAGQLVATHAVERAVVPLTRNLRRERTSCMRESLRTVQSSICFPSVNGQRNGAGEHEQQVLGLCAVVIRWPSMVG